MQCAAKGPVGLLRSQLEGGGFDSICPHDYDVMTARKISITHVISLCTHDLDVGVCLARSLARLIDFSVATAHKCTPDGRSIDTFLSPASTTTLHQTWEPR